MYRLALVGGIDDPRFVHQLALIFKIRKRYIKFGGKPMLCAGFFGPCAGCNT